MNTRTPVLTFAKEVLEQPDLQLSSVLKAIRRHAKNLVGGHDAQVCIDACDSHGRVIAYPDTESQDYTRNREFRPVCKNCPGRSESAPNTHANKGFESRCTFHIKIPERSSGRKSPVLKSGLAVCVRHSPNGASVSSMCDSDKIEIFEHVAAMAVENALGDEQQFMLRESAQIMAYKEENRELAMDNLAKNIARRMRFNECMIYSKMSDLNRIRVVGTTLDRNVLATRNALTRGLDGPSLQLTKETPLDPIVAATREPGVVVSNNMQSDGLCEVFYADRELEDSQQILAVRVVISILGKNGEDVDQLVGVLALGNKMDDSENTNRPIDALDLLECEFLADSLAPVLFMLEAERSRAERISRMRHDMYEPITMSRNSVLGKGLPGLRSIFTRAGVIHETFELIESLVEPLKQDGRGPHAALESAMRECRKGYSYVKQITNEGKRIDQQLLNIDLMCTILHAQVEAAKAISYKDFQYDFKRTLLVELLQRFQKNFETECVARGLDGISIDNSLTSRANKYYWLDATMFQVAIYNLLVNGLKYSNKRTQIWITDDLDDKWYTVKFSNWGIGIDEEDRERVFEKWYQSDKAKKLSRRGLGLGLYNVKHIVEAHRGRVLVTNLHNPTTISLQLPRWLADRSPQ